MPGVYVRAESGISSRLRSGRRLFSARPGDFYLHQCPLSLLGPTQPAIQKAMEDLSQGEKPAAVREVTHLRHSSAECKNEGS